MKIYHLKTCDTCRKAIKALSGRDPELIEIRQDGVPEALLDAWLERLGEDVLVNRKSTTWRNLDADARARPARELLAEHPTLLKRPVIVDGEELLVGWNKDVQTRLNV